MLPLNIGGTPQFRGRILVVDQDDWCQEFLSQVIKLWGLGEYYLARSVDEAHEILEQRPFDVIITDLNVPQFYQLLDTIRQRFPGIRIIVMLSQRSQVHQVFYLEQVEVVVKPLSLDEIARKIRDALRSKYRLRAEEELMRLKQEAFRI